MHVFKHAYIYVATHVGCLLFCTYRYFQLFAYCTYIFSRFQNIKIPKKLRSSEIVIAKLQF